MLFLFVVCFCLFLLMMFSFCVHPLGSYMQIAHTCSCFEWSSMWWLDLLYLYGMCSLFQKQSEIWYLKVTAKAAVPAATLFLGLFLYPLPDSVKIFLSSLFALFSEFNLAVWKGLSEKERGILPFLFRSCNPRHLIWVLHAFNLQFCWFLSDTKWLQGRKAPWHTFSEHNFVYI